MSGSDAYSGSSLRSLPARSNTGTTLGNASVIRAGDVQRMTAGAGVQHREYNHSRAEPLHFLQIWILPERKGLAPAYEQRSCSAAQKRARLCLLASLDGAVLVSEATETVIFFLLGAAIAVPVFARFGLGAVLGYLAAGVPIGPRAKRISSRFPSKAFPAIEVQQRRQDMSRDASADHPIHEVLRRRWSPCAFDTEREVAEGDLRALGLAERSFAHNGKDNKAAFHDLGAASASLSFEATARGLDVHKMIGIEPDKAREEFAIPESVEPFTGLAIGYDGTGAGLPQASAERDMRARERRSLDEILLCGGF